MTKKGMKNIAEKVHNYLNDNMIKYYLSIAASFLVPTPFLQKISVINFFLLIGGSFITMLGINKLIRVISLSLMNKTILEEKKEDEHKLIDLNEYRMRKNIKYDYSYAPNHLADIIEFKKKDTNNEMENKKEFQKVKE